MRDPGVRRERLAEAMREVLSELLLTEIKDPRLAGVVISAVELSGDLKLARAYFSVFGDAERERQAADGLQQARGFLRREGGRRMRIHNPPDLEFRRDKGFERADRVARLLDQISESRAQVGDTGGSDEGSSQTMGPGSPNPGKGSDDE
ncbi:MAG TPA: 30S ribosome-binding factor RbfA [Thermoanaerobaculaceae bacterium]|nr:30S ribosome-binding factor RbfA [Thermoanaerobaculaceae bacterium]